LVQGCFFLTVSRLARFNLVRPILCLPTDLRDKVNRWEQFEKLSFNLPSDFSDADVFSFFMQSSMTSQVKQRFIKNLGFYSLDSGECLWIQKANCITPPIKIFEKNNTDSWSFSILFETKTTIAVCASNPYKNNCEFKQFSQKKKYIFIENNKSNLESDFGNFCINGDGGSDLRNVANEGHQNVSQGEDGRSRREDSRSEDDVLKHVVRMAFEQQASDIHFYAVTMGYDIFLRVKGRLVYFKRHVHAGFDQRLKFRSNMDISIYNVAQDGRMSLDLSACRVKGAPERLVTVDLRVSSYPSFYGENFVLRLFSENRKFDIESGLGFSKKLISPIKNILKKQSGLFLVTGPTGSGKTTTLYGFMNWIVNQEKKHIISIEDPVEALIPGVQQSQIHDGFGFSDALKSILRQDPDVIILGEIRDASTAKIAIEAAYTGHLVFATLHTSSCWSAMSRLKSFGLDLFLVNHCLLGVLSQQLVQLKCSCGTGCEKCEFSTIKKRYPIHELLILNHMDFKQTWMDESAFDSHFFHRFKDDITLKKLGKELNTDIQFD
jgi:type II secretory ATPase GspE/PulE/Tfp pilus assembly ATPase PilB-like protein